MRPDGSKRGQQKCVATYADYALYPYAAGCCSQVGQIAKIRHELEGKQIVKLNDPKDQLNSECIYQTKVWILKEVPSEKCNSE